MENNTESLELEEMRLQMNALKAQLDEQVHVNDELILSQMKNYLHSSNIKSTFTLITGIAIIYPWYILCGKWGVSMVCFWALTIVMNVDSFANYYVKNMIREKDVHRCSFSALISKLLVMQKRMRILAILDFFALLVLPILLLYETSHRTGTNIPFIIIWGTICGFVFGGKEVKKRICKIDEMIKTLSERIKSEGK